MWGLLEPHTTYLGLLDLTCRRATEREREMDIWKGEKDGYMEGGEREREMNIWKGERERWIYGRERERESEDVYM